MEALGPYGPFADDDGRIFLTVGAGAKMLGVGKVVLGKWARAGRLPPPHNFELEVRQVPILKHSNTGGRAAPRTHMQKRWVIEQTRLEALAEILKQTPVRRGWRPGLKPKRRGPDPA